MCTEAPGPSSAPGSANASTCRASRETCAGVGAGAAATVGASGAAGGVGGAGAIEGGLGAAVAAGWSADGGGAAAALLDASAWCGAPAAPSGRGIAASISRSVALNPSVMARPTTRKPPRAASAPIRSGAVITSWTMWSSLPTYGCTDLCIEAPPSGARGMPAALVHGPAVSLARGDVGEIAAESYRGPQPSQLSASAPVRAPAARQLHLRALLVRRAAAAGGERSWLVWKEPPARSAGLRRTRRVPARALVVGPARWRVPGVRRRRSQVH